MSEISTVEIRELLNAVNVLATRPAASDETTIGTAIALFSKLIDCRTQGIFKIAMVVDGQVHLPNGESLT